MSSEDKSMNVDSDDELDWEEVEVPERQHLEITLDFGKPKNDKANKKRGISHAERIARIDCHKIHTIVLICNAKVRNEWVNDPLLQARLLSLTPLHLQNAFTGIHKSRVPDQNQRGRMFERAMEQLTKWWANTFFEVVPEGHIRNHTFEEIQQKLEIRGLHLPEDETPLDLESFQDIVDDDPEIIRSAKSLMKHALMQTGSRDTSAQLFTALCRGLGIPARLVVSIQSVPWKAGIDGHKTQSKSILKGRELVDIGYQSSDPGSSSVDPGATPMSEKSKGKQKANPVRLRKTKSKRQVLRAERGYLEPPDPLTTPPVFWTEVFSRPDSKWFPMDPIRGIVNNRKVFDPTQLNTGFRTKIENRMLYVLAFEEDGYARDVTRRYAKQYGARVAKLQGGSNASNVGGGGKGRLAWWDRVVNFLHRPFRLNRDDLEDQELDATQLMEGIPTTISGFKDHPLYVIERHLKQTETIYPPPPMAIELGKFRGEPVYSRSAVVSLKTAENWLRSTGRVVKEGEQPMKMVKVRPNTINKMRELEVLKDDLKVAGSDSPRGEGSSSAVAGDVMQGLYAFSQTEIYIPVPVIDGVVPKNNFGNIDLYVPSMLPQGAVHVPFKGVAKVAKKLGFDYAEAVTGFEFRKRRAFPVIEGVVVAAENEAVLLEAYWETEKELEEKARARKRERVLKRWIRLIHGLRIRQKLQEQYGSKSTDRNELDTDSTQVEQKEGHVQDDLDGLAGGFLAGADRVVTAFHLPKKTIMSSPPRQRAGRLQSASENEKSDESDVQEELELKTYDLDEESMDADPAGISSLYEGVEGWDFVPKTMQQIAEDAAKQEKEQENEHRRHGTGQTGTGVILQQASDSISTSTAKSIGRVTRSRSGAIKSETISNPSPEASKTPRGGRSSFTRWKGASANRIKRKRRRGVSESGDDAKTSQDVGGQEMDVGDDEESDEDEDEEGEGRHRGTRASSNKRPRNGRTTSAGKAKAKASAALAISSPTMTTGDVGTSGRTLRPRTSKTTAQIEQERQVEEAYSRAVAR